MVAVATAEPEGSQEAGASYMSPLCVQWPKDFDHLLLYQAL